jgi:hypothetical protein
MARSGRRIRAVELRLVCQHRTSRYDFKAAELKLSFRGRRGLSVQQDGSFAVSGSGGGRRFRVSGRFVTPQYARLHYRARLLLPRGADRRRYKPCLSPVEESPAALYRGGIPPFSGCRTQRALTLVASETSRVLQQYTLARPGGGWRPHAYACLFATPNRRVDLGQNYDDVTVELPRLAGTLLAYVAGETAIGGAFADIRILDMGDATAGRTVDATPGPPDHGTSRVHDLVLKLNGSISWMVGRGSYDPGFPSFQQQLWALDSTGQRMLDSGPSLELRSLELSGSTLTWVNDGIVRSAALD